MSCTNCFTPSRTPALICACVGVPVIPLEAFVLLPPRKAALSTSRTEPPCSSTLWAAQTRRTYTHHNHTISTNHREYH
ncbi:hypothetical protein LSM04_007794 [Trypanosoma melophagium]|uniref:uncharacterized protein n=1 Tax=Trypanosoma melophagium TaxID=715481 RepID=UPI00351A6E98|nr:hypothetical protein LSM04_007794 [Trypanosoma melophagium]